MKPRRPPTPDSISDWLLGGYRRRRLLALLFTGGNTDWTVAELREAAGCGQATAYETVMALREIDLLKVAERRHSFAIARDHPLAEPLSKIVEALQPFGERPVKRPNRGHRRA